MNAHITAPLRLIVGINTGDSFQDVFVGRENGFVDCFVDCFCAGPACELDARRAFSLGGREHHGSLARQQQEGHGLLKVEADGRVGMAEIADRDVLADGSSKSPPRVVSTTPPSIAGAQMILPSTRRWMCCSTGYPSSVAPPIAVYGAVPSSSA
jgi:hypothetical protein